MSLDPTRKQKEKVVGQNEADLVSHSNAERSPFVPFLHWPAIANTQNIAHDKLMYGHTKSSLRSLAINHMTDISCGRLLPVSPEFSLGTAFG